MLFTRDIYLLNIKKNKHVTSLLLAETFILTSLILLLDKVLLSRQLFCVMKMVINVIYLNVAYWHLINSNFSVLNVEN